MLADPFQGLKSYLHETVLGRVPWLERLVGDTLDMLSSPITGIKTRYHWVQLVEALILAFVVFWMARGALGVGWSGFVRFLFPKGMYSHPSSVVDYKLNFVNYLFGSWFNITWRLGTPIMVAGVVSALTWAFGPTTPMGDWGIAALVVFTIALWFIDDLGYYLAHLAAHKIPFLWAFHKVHHSAELLTIFTAGRVHPMEYAFIAPTRAATSALVLGPALYIYGSEPTLAAWYGITLWIVVSGALGEQLLHSHIWLSWGPFWDKIILSPALHQIHHSSEPRHWDKNFAGRFSVWDWLFGTLYQPNGHETFRYGIYGETRQLHAGVVSAYVRPFWDMLPFKRQILDAAYFFLGPTARGMAERWAMEPNAKKLLPESAALRRARLITLVGLAGILAGTAALYIFWMMPNHDNDWWLILTERFLHGGRYLRDYMETNPPILALLLVPPVALELAIGMDRNIPFVLYVVALIALSVALIWRVLRGFMENRRFATGGAAIAITLSLCLLPGYDFGQREHIFLILFLPGLFWLAAREAGRDAGFGLGPVVLIAMATVALLIKPFYLIVLAPLFLLRLFHHGLSATVRDPAPWIIAAVTAGFGAMLVVFFPEYFTTASMHWQVYFAFERSWMTVVTENKEAFVTLFLAVALTELLPLSGPQRVFLRHLSVVAAMCLLMGVIQKKGFGYQFLPALQLAFIVVICATFAACRAIPEPSLPWPQALAVLLLVLGQTSVLALRPAESWLTFSRPYNLASPVIQALRAEARGKSLLIIDSGFRGGVPYLVEARLVGRAPSQLLLPGTIKLAEGTAAQKEKAAEMRKLATEQLVDDIARNRPDVIGVHVGLDRQAIPADFDILDFYIADPAFKREFAAYTKVNSVRGWDIYRRKPD